MAFTANELSPLTSVTTGGGSGSSTYSQTRVSHQTEWLPLSNFLLSFHSLSHVLTSFLPLHLLLMVGTTRKHRHDMMPLHREPNPSNTPRASPDNRAASFKPVGDESIRTRVGRGNISGTSPYRDNQLQSKSSVLRKVVQVPSRSRDTTATKKTRACVTTESEPVLQRGVS